MSCPLSAACAQTIVGCILPLYVRLQISMGTISNATDNSIGEIDPPCVVRPQPAFNFAIRKQKFKWNLYKCATTYFILTNLTGSTERCHIKWKFSGCKCIRFVEWRFYLWGECIHCIYTNLKSAPFLIHFLINKL